jgi:hypothetical protein
MQVGGGKPTISVLLADPQLAEWLDAEMWRWVPGVHDGAVVREPARCKVPGGWLVGSLVDAEPLFVHVPGADQARVVELLETASASGLVLPGQAGFGVGVVDDTSLREGKA